MQIKTIGASRTMSSREIAGLTEKEHKHVLRDVRVMLEQLEYAGPGLVHFWTDPQNGRDYHEYLLPEDLTLTLVSGYSVQMRHRIIKRWQELESGALPALPRTFSEALRALADKTDLAEQQAAALALAAPKVEFVDRYVQATTSSMGIREVVKLLKTNGHTVNEHSFTAWLVDRGFMYRKKAAPGKLGHLTPSAQHEAAGRFDTKTGQGHGGINVPVHKFTGKGVEWVAGEWAKHQIRAEVAA